MAEWIEVAKVDEIGSGGLIVKAAGEEALLIKDGEVVHAIASLCSHQEMELEGGRCEGGAWLCPHHGAKFSLSTGEALSMPAVESIEVYQSKVEGGRVFLSTDNGELARK